VDVRFEKDGRTIVIIDTAGIRKVGKISNSIEFYSHARAFRSIKRADVVLLMIDATAPISQVDKKLAELIADEYKSCIIVINKWDLAKNSAATGDYEQYLTDRIPALKYVPIAFTTANKNKNVQSVLDLAAELFKQATIRIPTPRLNRVFESIKVESGFRRTGQKGRTKQPRVYYATQISTNPVTIMMSVNDPSLFDENHRRYIVNRLQELLPIGEIPIRLLARSHRRTPQKRTLS
jgi:GTP-binding protein